MAMKRLSRDEFDAAMAGIQAKRVELLSVFAASAHAAQHGICRAQDGIKFERAMYELDQLEKRVKALAPVFFRKAKQQDDVTLGEYSNWHGEAGQAEPRYNTVSLPESAEQGYGRHPGYDRQPVSRYEK